MGSGVLVGLGAAVGEVVGADRAVGATLADAAVSAVGCGTGVLVGASVADTGVSAGAGASVDWAVPPHAMSPMASTANSASAQ